MTSLKTACIKLDTLIRLGVDINHQKEVENAWIAMSKKTYSSQINRQKLENLRGVK